MGQFFVFARELNEIGRVIFETIVFDKESVEPTNSDQFSLPAMRADLLIGESLQKLLEVLALNSGREIQACFVLKVPPSLHINPNHLLDDPSLPP